MRPWFLILISTLIGLTAVAADPQPVVPKAEGPVNIRSDKLVVDQKRSQAIFSGSVRVVQDTLQISCQRLVVTYSGQDESGQESGKIKRMKFSGQVAIEQKSRQGHCDQAVYLHARRSIVCTGDPWVKEGENLIRGERIEYLLDQDQVLVEKPRAVIHLEDVDEKGQRKKP